MSEVETAPAKQGVNKILEMGEVFYKNFGFLDERIPSENGRLYIDRPKRMKNSTTFFSLSCAMMEVSTVAGFEADVSDIATRVSDTLFRGTRDDVDSCLVALNAAKIVKLNARRINVKDRTTCVFTQAYVDKIRDYSMDIFELVAGHRNVPDRWLPMSRAIFDFMRYKYIPEWYLLMRKVLRTSRLSERVKEDIYHGLFNSTGTWFAVNYLVAVYASGRNSRITEEQFVKILIDNLKITRDEADKVIGDLTQVGLCGNEDGDLVIESKVQDFVSEYSNEVDRDYGKLHDALSRMAI